MKKITENFSSSKKKITSGFIVKIKYELHKMNSLETDRGLTFYKKRIVKILKSKTQIQLIGEFQFKTHIVLHSQP